jgi:hypothetical protein
MNKKRKYNIQGIVSSKRDGLGVPNLRIETWDKDLVIDDLLGSTKTDENGRFSLSFDETYYQEICVDRKPDVYFKVFLEDKEIHSTKDKVIWNFDNAEKEITIEIDLASLPSDKDINRFTVSGTVRTIENIPVQITVEALYKEVCKKAVSLGKVKTNEDGSYQINYTKLVEKRAKDKQIDLFVQCYDKKGAILDKSKLLIDAPKNAIVNLTVPKEIRRAPTAVENLGKQFGEQLEGIEPADLQDDSEHIAAKLKLDIKEVKRFIHALVFEQQAREYKTQPRISAEIFYGLISDEELPKLESLVNRNTSILKQLLQEAVNKDIIPFKLGEKIDQFVSALKKIAVAIAIAKPSDPNVYSLRNLIDINDALSDELKNGFIRDYTLNEEGDTRFWEKLKENKKFEKHLPSIQDLFTLAELTRKNLPLIHNLYEKSGNINELAKWEIEDWKEYLRNNKFPVPANEDGQKSTQKEYAQALARGFKQRFALVDLINSMEKSKVLTDKNKPSAALKNFLRQHLDFDLGKVPVDRYLKQAGIRGQFNQEIKKAKEKKQREKIKQQQDTLIKELRHLQLAHTLAPVENHNECVAALKEFEMEEYSYQPSEPGSKKGEKEESHIEGVTIKEAKTDSVIKTADGNIADLISKWQEFGKKKTQKTKKSQTEPLSVRRIKADSALKIASMNKADFITTWQELRKKDGATDRAVLRGEAEEIYNRAQYQAFSFAVNAWNIAAPLSSVTPAFVSNLNTNIQNQMSSYSSDTALTIANLTTLFGNQHYCECRHCQSIYSPAAYLVQLYNSLSKIAQYKLLYERRPDIRQLHLNCENTNTKLPYIDLVIEQLERLVLESASSQFTQDYPWPNLQTTLSEKELALRPEHEFSDAYVLLSSFPYPISLPWDKWFEEARRYLDYMELPLYRLVEIFTPPLHSPLSREVASDYHRDRKNQLNSKQCVRALYDLISKPLTGDEAPRTFIYDGNNLAPLFAALSDSPADVKKLTDFMGKLGLWQKNEEGKTGKEDFKLFKKILGTRYIRGSRNIKIIFEKDNPCDPTQAEIRNLDRDTIVRTIKFEHLRLALGWSPDELNQAIIVFSRLKLESNTCLETGAISERLLAQISHLIRIRERRPSFSIMELLAWWGTIDTGAGIRRIPPSYIGEEKEPDRISLYEKVFLDKSLYGKRSENPEDNLEWNYFILNSRKTELAYLDNGPDPEEITAHKTIICAALQLSEKELLEVTNFVGNTYFDGVGESLELNLNNLSALYRVVSMVHYLDISIHEFILLHKFMGNKIEPFKWIQDSETIETETTLIFIECVEKIKRSPFEIRDLVYLWQHRKESEEELEYINERINAYLPQLKERLEQAKKEIPLQEAMGNPPSIEEIMLIFLPQELVNFFGTSQGVVKKLLVVLKSVTIVNSTLLQDFIDWDDSPEAEETIRNHILRLEKIVQIVDCWKLTAEEIEHIQTHGSDFQEFDWNKIPITNDDIYATQPVYKEWSALANYVEVRNHISLTKGDLIELFANARDPENKTAAVLEKLKVLLNLELGEIHLIANDLEYIDDISSPELKYQSLRNGESIKPVIEIADAIKRCGRSFEVVRTWVSKEDIFELTGDTGRVGTVVPDSGGGGTGRVGTVVPDSGGGGTGRVGTGIPDSSGVVTEHEVKYALSLDASFMSTIDFDQYADLLVQYKQGVVEEIRNAVKARFGENQWREVARDFQDQMRILQRDKLLDFVITWVFRESWAERSRTLIPLFNRPEDVYDFLLIDPLVNPCMNITRLKLAISSVQLFIHRILMGLEGEQLKNEDETTTLADEWKWKKNYQVWEAQQKVFIYPENWIEPELRDNKTPFFEEFGGELSQSEIDEKSIEKAYKNYLQKVDEVGNLEVVALKEEIILNDQDKEIGRELHVIGRTREKPHTCYYRKRNCDDIWLPWERIDLDIDSEVVLLTIYNGLPYIFWPTVKERVQKLGQDKPDDDNNDRTNYLPVLDIRFNWSSYQDGRWLPKKKNDESVVLMYDWKYLDLVEKAEELLSYHFFQHQQDTKDEGLRIDITMAAKSHWHVEKYTWNDDKLKEIFLKISCLPSEIDWEYIQPGWDAFKANGLSMDTIEIIKDSVETIAEQTEKQLKINLYAQPLVEDPFEFTRRLVSGHVHTDISWGGQPGLSLDDYEILWFGILGHFLSYLPNGFETHEDSDGVITYTTTVRNIKDDGDGKIYYGLRPSDLMRINEALGGLYNISDSIELTRKMHRYLTIDKNTIADDKFITFARVLFSGYKLKPKVTNSLGLISVDNTITDLAIEASREYLPKSLNIISSAAPRLSEYKIKDKTTNSPYNYIVKFCNNQTTLNYIGNNANSTELTYKCYARPQDYRLFLTSDSKASLTTADYGLNFQQFFYHDFKYCYLLEHNTHRDLVYACTTFYHPFIGKYNEILRDYATRNINDRFDRLLRLDEQHKKMDFPLSIGNPSDLHLGQYLFNGEINCKESNHFYFDQPFSIYNWEIFFHMPFTIAVRLSQQKKFAEAQQWFHYIFNPLASLSLDDGQEYDEASKYWNFLPLHKEGRPWTGVDILRKFSFASYDLDDETYNILTQQMQNEIKDLAKDPFQPHRIARKRQGAYQKAVVMKYLDNLIEWGDYLFSQDTIESINEAAHLYILAAKILGPRPRLVPKQKGTSTDVNSRGQRTDLTVQDVTSYSERMVTAEFGTMQVTAEEFPPGYHTLPSEVGLISTLQWFQGLPLEADDSEESPSRLGDTPIFCVPHNEKLLSYWDIVANRLFKVRNCMNIEGEIRELPIFEPPIDPGLLVRGQALGIDINELLSHLYAPLPPYRFNVMLQKAYEFCGDVQKLGGALLSAMEKKDAEELSLLRSKHERQMLKLTEDIKKQKIKELRENLKSLLVSLEMAESRFEYYNSRKFENQNEKAQVSKLNTANDFSIASQIVSLAASAAYALPQVHIKAGFPPSGSLENEWGGLNLGNALSGMSQFLNLISSVYSHEANMHSIQGGRERRMDDWKFQSRQSSKEIKQIKKQLLATEIRLDIAEKELKNHAKQQEQAEEIATFMKSKFTNKQLYHWMISQISGIYFQTYKMAVELAKIAQKCYWYEKGDDTATFIGAAYWDNLKKGLLSGEKLQFDLRRMESEYLHKNKREQEITKNISLKALDPVELDKLRYTGRCAFNLPELLFDLDHPGHYYRRIKSLSISIPCVVGPYSAVNCTLRLGESKTRKKQVTSDDELEPDPLNKDKISLSTGQNDSGLFELNHNDERYLPFELRGVVSKWELEFPSALEQFDRSTISDVIMHIRYTALMGDKSFKDKVNEAITETYKKFNTLREVNNGQPVGMAQRFDIRREFPDLWHKFVETQDIDNNHKLKLKLTKELFPYLLRPIGIELTHLSFFCEMKEDANVKVMIIEPNFTDDSQDITLTKVSEGPKGKYYFTSDASKIEPAVNVSNDPVGIIISSENSGFKELILVLHYDCKQAD